MDFVHKRVLNYPCNSICSICVCMCVCVYVCMCVCVCVCLWKEQNMNVDTQRFMLYGNLQSNDFNLQHKNYSVIVSKRKGDVNSAPYSQKLLPAKFPNETTALICSIFVLKNIICKTLIVQTKTAASRGILREIFQ